MDVTPYLVGIDLGTTNIAVAYVETGGRPIVRLFRVPQLVAPHEVSAAPMLPAFLYFADDEERASGAVSLPWDERPDAIVGVLARERGAIAPTRQVSSAKSWLAHGGVDRTAAILPWGSEPTDTRISPVDASTRYLTHIRDAWNHEHARHDEHRRLERQTIVLTVPASFDEEARELTVQAARAAGFDRLVLLEEPLAALYAWIATHRHRLASDLAGIEHVLVCDVGGGTTDFSLFRVNTGADQIAFERTAVGEHLLLGGDNVDVALAHLVEARLGRRLGITQRQALRRQCSAAKERLLTEDNLTSVPVTVLGAGRAVVGGSVTTDLHRDEVERALLDGFLPLTARSDQPTRDRRQGLRELGLPFESEPAITRHLAAFLARTGTEARPEIPHVDSAAWTRPDAILFNGGFFAPAVARQRLADTVASWAHADADTSGWSPSVLSNADPAAAVAVGAAFYAHIRATPEHQGLLVRAGSPRSFYIAVRAGAATGDAIHAVSLMPRGTQEGTDLDLGDRRFKVATNSPVAFTLYSTMSREDPQGALVALAPADDLHRHAPLATVLRYGKRSRRAEIDVRVRARYTEVGTLELWCEAVGSDHRWRLQFGLRGQEDGTVRVEGSGEQESTDEETSAVVVAPERSAEALALVREVFERGVGSPEPLVGSLEALFGVGKAAWPMSLVRPLADALIAASEGRRRSAAHEGRWLNLFGFCLRPGFGAASDEWRVGEARRVYAAGLAFPKDVQCQVEWLVLWQRVAGGFSAGQQRDLYQRVGAQIGLVGSGKPKRLHPQLEREGWRLLASLERLDAKTRASLGARLLERLARDQRNASLAWALGRLTARVPFHGPLNTVIPPAIVSRWATEVLAWRHLSAEARWALAEMTAFTGDEARDVEEPLRELVAAQLRAGGVPAISTEPAGDTTRRGALQRLFGESLPEGLRLE